MIRSGAVCQGAGRKDAMRKNIQPHKVGAVTDPQQTLKGRFNGSGHAGDTPKRFSWSTANPLELADAVSRCTDNGDAIMFGRTRDGGAAVITILAGEERQRFYPAGDKAVSATLRTISRAYMSNAERIENGMVNEQV